MKRKVIYARLHEPIHVPTLGQLDKSLPPQNKTIKGLELYYDESGLHLEVGKFDFLVPYPAVALVQMEKPKETDAKTDSSGSGK